MELEIYWILMTFTDDFFSKKNDPPAKNVKEDNENFELELAVPGFSKKNIEVTMDDDVLCICGKKESEEETEKVRYTRREFSSSSFERKIQLQQEVNPKQRSRQTTDTEFLNLNYRKSRSPLNSLNAQ